MKIPVGAVLRAVVPKSWTWAHRLLGLVEGVEIKRGGTTIALDENQGAAPLRGSKFDSTPHKPGPPQSFGPRR